MELCLSGTDPELLGRNALIRPWHRCSRRDQWRGFLAGSSPAIDTVDGEITFTVADDDHGSFTLPITVTDDYNTGGTGDDLSTLVNVVVTVTEVNDDPSFSLTNQTIDEDPAGPEQTVAEAAWLASEDDGDPTAAAEDDQSLSYTVGAPDNGALFAVAPALTDVAGEWVLTYTPALNANGSADVEITGTDDGTTDGVAAPITLPSQTLTITVNAVDDPEVAIDDEYILDVDTKLGRARRQLDRFVLARRSVGNDQAADVDGDTLTVFSNEVPDSRRGSHPCRWHLHLRRDPDFIGDAPFTYHVTDGVPTSRPRHRHRCPEGQRPARADGWRCARVHHR